MIRFRFSLAGLIIAVAVLAACFASLRSASGVWARVVFTLTLFVLLVAVAGLLFAGREMRVFWGGFALFGWCYLVLVFGPWFHDNVSYHLATTQLLDYLYESLRRHVPPPGPAVGETMLWVRSDGTLLVNEQAVEELELSDRIEQIRRLGKTLLLYIDDNAPQTLQEAVTQAIPRSGMTVRSIYTQVLPDHSDLHRVGQSVLALAFALLGGLVARYFHGTRPKPDEHTRRPQGAC